MTEVMKANLESEAAALRQDLAKQEQVGREAAAKAAMLSVGANERAEGGGGSVVEKKRCIMLVKEAEVELQTARTALAAGVAREWPLPPSRLPVHVSNRSSAGWSARRSGLPGRRRG